MVLNNTNDKIIKVLKDLRDILIHKRKSYQGVIGNQNSIDNKQMIERKINKLTQRIDEVNNCITLRASEIANHVSLD